MTGSSGKTEISVGDRMPDGTIYAGLSPETGKGMYTTRHDAKLTHSFNQAKDYAAGLDAHGHTDWRVPTKGELNVLYNNRAAIGGFNVTGLDSAGWYWSSSENGAFTVEVQRFSDGDQYFCANPNRLSLRCVR